MLNWVWASFLMDVVFAFLQNDIAAGFFFLKVKWKASGRWQYLEFGMSSVNS